MERRDYIELLTNQIRCKKMCPVIAREMEDHIDDQKQAFIREGMTKAEAEEAAIREMGDPVEVGVEMDRIHRPKMPWKVILIIGILQILSGIFSIIISGKSGGYLAGSGIVYIFRSLISFFVMIVICYIDYSWIGKFAKYLAGGYLLCMLLARHFLGGPINGAVRWIGLGGFGISLSILSWLFIPLFGAVLYQYRGNGYAAVWKAGVWIGVMMGILLTCPDSMTAGTVGISCILMLIFAVKKGWYKVAVKKVILVISAVTIGMPVGILLYYLFFGETYQRLRIFALFGLHKAEMAGTALLAIRKFLTNCVWVGSRGDLAAFFSKNTIDISDYMMIGIAGYCGILVLLLLVGAIAGVLCWFLKSVLKQKNQLGMLMGFGCVMVLMIQSLLAIMANLGITSLGEGAWCLFFGYGRTGQIVSAVLMGIMLSIYRHQNVIPEVWLEKRAIEG